MIHELRIYRVNPGRMTDLQQRFTEHVLPLWEKHGIRQVGFWTTLVGESIFDLTYMLAWESLAEQEAKWGAFMHDPAWAAAYAVSEQAGPLLTNVSNSFLSPTEFSALR